MAEKDGQTTQAGINYQDKIAALFLGRMIDPRATRLPADQQAIEVPWRSLRLARSWPARPAGTYSMTVCGGWRMVPGEELRYRIITRSLQSRRYSYV